MKWYFGYKMTINWNTYLRMIPSNVHRTTYTSTLNHRLENIATRNSGLDLKN